jgi:hypothetical protein
MTIIKKTIQDLKPNKRYLIKVEAFDNNLGTVAAENSIIIETPSDTSVPGSIEISNFKLYNNSKSLMFKFSGPNDEDLKGYEYQVYSQNNLSETYLIQSRRKYK